MNRFELVTDQSQSSADAEAILWPVTDSVPGSLKANVDPWLASLGTVDPRAIDLVRLATGALVADRRCRRPSGWSRTIHLQVSITTPGAWSEAIVIAARLLRLLTGDMWHLTLVGDSSTKTAAEPAVAVTERVSLFSGGLDSFASAMISVCEDSKNKKSTTFVSHRDNPIVAGSQNRTSEWVRDHLAADFKLETIALAQTRSVIEHSSRSRAFLFLALAIASATSHGAQYAIVPENGFTSINPPLGEDRGGPLSTRSTHPMTLYLFNAMLEALDLNVRITNPYEWLTKGELVSRAVSQAALDLRDGVAGTLSCGKLDGRWYTGGNVNLNCGLCVSCVVRRASIVAAALQDDTEYLCNRLTGSSLDDLVRNRRSDIEAIKAISQRGMMDTDVIGAGPFPPGFDIDRAVDICQRAAAEIRAVGLP